MNKVNHTFGSGLRLAHFEMQGVRSVAIGVTVAVGSCNETPENNGISHLVEHMLFKGTKTRNAFQIAAEIDGIGAHINAYTSKQTTCYYTFSIRDQVEKCADVLSDILFNSTFEDSELKREKGVVIEEIAESMDDPSDVSTDCLAKAYFGKHPLGMTILGPKQNIEKFTVDDLKKYVADNYNASSTVISIVGNISANDAVKLVEKYFEGRFSSGAYKSADFAYDTKSAFESYEHDFEQSSIGIAFPSYAFNSKNDAALRLVNTVFGGGMSSRLFQSVRERLGLAYSVFSYPSAYINNGYMTIYVGTNPKTAKLAVEAIKKETDLLIKDGITDDEFLRGKEQLKGAYILEQEQPLSLMRIMSKFALFASEKFDFEKQIQAICYIKKEDVRSAIADVFDRSKVSASYAGKKTDFDILEILRG